jgi:HAD superfamily hydrolase (TIGR01509 family)
MVCRAVIFDMDGLMLDTERLRKQLFERVLAEHGMTLPDGVYLQTIGRTVRDTRLIFAEHMGADFPYEALRLKRRDIEYAHIDQHGVPTKPGLESILEWLEARAFPRAVATSSAHATAHRLLQAAGVRQRFEIVVGGDEVTHGKPEPDLFLLAAERLGVAPSNCVVLEDSSAGIRAAHRAGMTPILVPDLQLPEDEVRALAYRICASLHEAETVLAELLPPL